MFLKKRSLEFSGFLLNKAELFQVKEIRTTIAQF